VDTKSQCFQNISQKSAPVFRQFRVKQGLKNGAEKLNKLIIHVFQKQIVIPFFFNTVEKVSYWGLMAMPLFWESEGHKFIQTLARTSRQSLTPDCCKKSNKY